jgi:tetratricopeptide (TPR) repeat protein
MASAAEHHSRAVSLRLAGDLEGAVASYRLGLALAPGSAETWNELGTALRSLGRFGDAAASFRRALALKPGFADAYRNLALCGELGAKDADTARVAALAADKNLAVEERSAAGFALGKLLDDAGRYDEAFAAFGEANALYRQSRTAAGERFSIAALRREIDETIAAFTADFFTKTAGQGVADELPVFVLGMPRSGTSLVEQIGASHSRVHGAGELLDIARIAGELGPPAAGTAQRWHEADIAAAARDYLDRLRALGGGAVRVIDKMPDNVLHMGLIATLLPRARIVLCRRDARDTCLSCFFQQFTPGTQLFSYDLADCGRRHLEIDRLIEHWRHVLPIPVLEVEYERLVGDLEGESRRLIDFLGLDWEERCLDFHRTDRTVTTASSWQVRQPLYDRSVGRWRHYERHLAPLVAALSGGSDESEPAASPQSEDVASLLRQAQEEHKAGRLAAAEALYRRVLESAPQHPQVLLALGTIAGQNGNDEAAAQLSRQAIAIAPQHAVAHFNLGYALRRLGRTGEAEAAFRNATTLQPRYAEAHSNLGQILLAAGRDAEALASFRALVALQPDNYPGRFALATCLRRNGELRASLSHLERVVVLAPTLVSGWMDLGLTHLMLGHWPEAESALLRVLALEPGHAEATRRLDYLRRQRNLDSPEVTRLTAELRSTTLAPAERTRAEFALADALDGARRYDAAFVHYVEGNTVLQRQQEAAGQGFDGAALQRTVDSILGRFTEASCAALPSSGNASELPVFLLGMPHSGAAIVAHIAARHSRIATLGKVELPALEGSPASWRLEMLQRAADDYLRQAHAAAGAERGLDCAPGNLFRLAEIATLFPRAHVIFCIRDPRDTAFAGFSRKDGEQQSFAQSLADCARQLVATTRLARHWQATLKLPMLEIRYETLLADPVRETRRMIEFLGLAWEDACVEELGALLPDIREIERWRHYQAHLGVLFKILGEAGL